MTAQIIKFPTPPEQSVSCFECDHAYLGSSGVYCRLFNVDVVDENEAEDCEEFEA